jgi:hypothetical protein
MASEREALLFSAKVAEQAERYVFFLLLLLC